MKKLSTLLFLLIIFIQPLIAQNEARLMRFPAIYGNNIIFSYAGDLFTVARSGGLARKLTSDKGYEMFAHFSPDGKNIAFTGQYDGNTEIYLMPSEGGEPTRLTYTATLSRDDVTDRMGPNNIALAWTPDGKNIIYRSRKKTFNDFKGKLFSVSIDGGLSQELPLPAGGFCSFSPDGKKLAYNRVFREFRTWKYYKGGMADDVWIYDNESKTVENITNNVSQDIFPMWTNEKIYFLSDRNRIMNLFCYDLKTKETRKVTDFKEYDIKFPSLGNDAIVFENGGFIYVFDLKTEKAEKVTIQIADDFVGGRSEIKDASKFINTYDVSPDGKRLTFDARGDIFTVPAKTGITRNISQSSGVHERNPAWSPDGKNIAFISDATGEDEIYIQAQDGSSKPIQISKNSDTYKYFMLWSPDSKKLLWADKKLRLQYVDVDSKAVTIVDESKDWEFTEYNWSPDSKWITYVRPDKASLTQIYIYNLDTKIKTPVTESWYQSSTPVFSNDGKYLLFSSSRDFKPIYTWTEWNHAYVDMQKVYLITLAKETTSPFAPIDDEVGVIKIPAITGDNKDKEKNKSTTVKIDLDQIQSRIVSFPVESSSYWNIHSVGENVYYIKKSYSDKKSILKVYNLKDRKEATIGTYDDYIIAAEGKKMLISSEEKYSIIDLPKAATELKDFANLSNMQVFVNLKEEWAQIYNESWRQMRDFFYDPNMQGVNWITMKTKYAQLLPYVNNRSDLTYIIGELIGELNVGHAYTGGGDKKQINKIEMGLLGAEMIKDPSGYFKITYILKGENWNTLNRSPLNEIGVNVNAGDFILAVNGKSTKDVKDIYSMLVNTAGKQIELTINSSASEQGSHKEVVVPIADESKLLYLNWVKNNIEKVNKASNGQIGYIHIPDMTQEGLNQFVKYFYPQMSKKALIIDDRGNGGGNVSTMIIERLNRELAMYKMSRNTSVTSKPGEINLGPKVCLIDQYSASDGDLFPYQFKKLKIGKVIGVRSWGGTVGIRGSLPFVDGGYLNKPEFAHFDSEGKDWIVEGHGVDPDIKVENDPTKEYNGEDEQLNKAVEILLEELKTKSVETPAIPPFPDKSK